MTVLFSEEMIAERTAETMPKETEYTEVERFKRKGRSVVIRTDGDRTEIVIDGEPHEIRFLDNGRPWTEAYVNVMASSVRDLAERWIDFQVAQDKHWAKVDERHRADGTDKTDAEENEGGDR